MMPTRLFLFAALLLLCALSSIVGASAESYACIPCPNNDCTGKTYGDHCRSGVCNTGTCLYGPRRDSGDLAFREEHERSDIDGLSATLDSELNFEKRLGESSHGCMLWVASNPDASKTCDHCDASKSGQYKCRNN